LGLRYQSCLPPWRMSNGASARFIRLWARRLCGCPGSRRSSGPGRDHGDSPPIPEASRLGSISVQVGHRSPHPESASAGRVDRVEGFSDRGPFSLERGATLWVPRFGRTRRTTTHNRSAWTVPIPGLQLLKQRKRKV
jgi:hypothetical protein